MECFICYGQACRLQEGGSSDLSTQLKTGVQHAAHKEVYRQFGSPPEILSTFENMETTSQPPIPSFPLPIIPILPLLPEMRKLLGQSDVAPFSERKCEKD